MELVEVIVVVTIILLIVVIIVVYIINVRMNTSKELIWVPLQNNPLRNQWDMNDDLKVFKLQDPKSEKSNKSGTIEKFLSVQKIKKGDGLILDIPRYNKFYELCVYAYPDFSMVRTIPYPLHLEMKCPDDIKPGKYVFILRCKGQGVLEWATKPSLKYGKVKKLALTQSNITVNMSDTGSYEALGRYYQTISLNREDNLIRDIVSTNIPVAPLSVFIHHEHAIFDLESSQNAIIIFPNRSRTMNSTETIIINGTIIEPGLEDGFNSYEVSGKNHQRVIVDQYIYGNMSQDILAFYIYISS